jgi:hemolysin D
LLQLRNDLNQISPQAFDFRADLFTIEHSPPSNWPRGLLLAITVLIVAVGCWVSFAQLDIVATAQGRIAPISFNKTVQSAETGVVVAILVKDGDTVVEGQTLLRLDPRSSQFDVGAISRDVAFKALTLKRIEAELNDKQFIAPIGSPPEIALQLVAQFTARRQSLSDAQALETESLNKANADLSSAMQILDKLRFTLPMIKKSVDSYEKLFKDGFVGDVLANEKRRELIEKEQEIKSQQAIAKGLESVIKNIERKLFSIKSNYRSQLENERLEVATQLNRSRQELDKLSFKSDLLEIKAPSSGVIKELAFTSKGGVVQVGVPILKIVPQNEGLIAEVTLENDDAGFVSVGQVVQLKVAAFPFQKYGLLQGKVVHIGADTISQTQTTNPQTGFRVLIGLDQSALKDSNGAKLPLTAGLIVFAEIHQGKRSILRYLLDPIHKVASESARER